MENVEVVFFAVSFALACLVLISGMGGSSYPMPLRSDLTLEEQLERIEQRDKE